MAFVGDSQQDAGVSGVQCWVRDSARDRVLGQYACVVVASPYRQEPIVVEFSDSTEDWTL